jgi:hypothetical protein
MWSTACLAGTSAHMDQLPASLLSSGKFSLTACRLAAEAEGLSCLQKIIDTFCGIVYNSSDNCMINIYYVIIWGEFSRWVTGYHLRAETFQLAPYLCSRTWESCPKSRT